MGEPGSFQDQFEPARLRPARQSLPLVARPRIGDWVDQAAPPRVVMFDGPVGCGKSVAMAQAYQRSLDAGIPAAWATLAEAQRDPAALAAIVATALETIGVRVQVGGGDAVAIVDAIAAALGDRRATLFIDDWHRAETVETNAILGRLLNQGPDGLTLVIGSRHACPVPLSPLIVSGSARIFRGAQLVFTRDEAAACWGEQTVDGTTVDRLWTASEGWPALLQLARLTGAETLSASDPAVRDYLAELIGDIDEALLGTLQQVAMFDRICGTFVNEVLDRTDGAALLGEIERRNLLLRPTGDPAWYEFHPLFATLLRERLGTSVDIAEIDRLLAAGAMWMARKGDCASAIGLALRAHKPDLAAELFERYGGLDHIMQHGLQILRRLRDVDIPALTRFPGLALGLIYLDIQSGRAREARAAIDPILERLSLIRPDPADAEIYRILVFAHTIAGILSLIEDREVPTASVALLTDFVLAPATDMIAVRMALCVVVSHALTQRDYRTGLKLASRAPVVAGGDAPYVTRFLCLCVAIASGALGYIDEAERYLAVSRSLVEPDTEGEGIAELFAHFLLAQILVERGEVSAAWIEIAPWLDRLPASQGWLDANEASLAAITTILRRTRGASHAISYLRERRRLAARQSFARIDGLLLAIEVQELTLACAYDDARTIVALPAFRELLDPGFWLSRSDWAHIAPRVTAAFVRLALVTGDITGAIAALDRFDTHWTPNWNVRDEIVILLMRAMAHQAAGHDQRAAAAAARIAALIARTGQCIYVAEEPSALVEPVLAMIETHIMQVDPHLAGRLRTLLASQSASPRGERQRLSPREREVLVMLSNGYSSKEMARELGLTESTLKAYRKSLFGKLNVHNRSTALRMARDLGLLSG